MSKISDDLYSIGGIVLVSKNSVTYRYYDNSNKMSTKESTESKELICDIIQTYTLKKAK